MKRCDEMFVQKNCTEIINIEHEIKVVGLSLEKFGFSKQAEKIGDLWGVYEKLYREKVANVQFPVVNYGFWYSKPDGDYDYLAGSAVTDVENIDDELIAHSIPSGKYIKVSFNAKNFSDLVCEYGIVNSFNVAHKHAEANNLKIKAMPSFRISGIEVYPHERMCIGKENGPKWGLLLDKTLISASITQFPEMYTITAIE